MSALEYGWLIERGDSPHYAPAYLGESDEGCVGWTGDNLKAIRFARKEDAQRYCDCEGLNNVRICEHGWG